MNPPLSPESGAARPASPVPPADPFEADPWSWADPDHSPMLAPTLSAVGLALIALFTFTTLNQLLPPRLLVPAWQLRAASALIDTGPWALIGLVLLQLGAYLDPTNEPLQRRWHRLGRLGVVAVLGFLLLLPLQGVAAALSLQTASNVQSRQQASLERNFSLLREQIQAASSFPDLQRRIRAIQAPDLMVPAEALRLPLPALKRQLLANVDRTQQRLRRNLSQARAPERSWSFLQGLARGLVSTLALALGFAAATPSWRAPQVSLLQQWRWGLGQVLQRPRRRARLQLRAEADDFLRQFGYEEEPPAPGADLEAPPPTARSPHPEA